MPTTTKRPQGSKKKTAARNGTQTSTRPKRRTSRGKGTRPLAVEDQLRIVSVVDPNISPDGSAVVFVRKVVGEKKNELESSLWITPTKGDGEPRAFTGGTKDRMPRWSPDGSTLAFVRDVAKGRPQVHLIRADGGEAVALTDFPEGSMSALRWSPDGARLAVSFREQDPEWTEAAKKERKEKGLSDPPRVIDHYWYRFDGDGYFIAQRYHLYLVDAGSGQHRRVYAKDTLGFFEFDFAPDGDRLVISTNRDRRAGLRPWNDDLLVVDCESGKAEPIPDLPRGPKARPRWSPDGRYIAYAGRVGDDPVYSTENLELWVYDTKRKTAESRTGDEDYCLMAPPITDTAEVAFEPTFLWAPDGKRIYVLLGWHGECHVASIAPAKGSLTFHTSGPITCSLGTIADDGKHMALTVGAATKLDEVHVAKLSSSSAELTRLTGLNDELLDELELSAPTAHWVKTADGTKVQTWIMLPPGRPAKGRKRPAVLEIHGGPHGQYGVGFFFEMQLLAAAGYVVVFSNPRGSKGYGRDHCAAIRGKWGTADWVDIQAVTAFMKDRPEIDERRMAVMGGSYGGYMTNWVIGHTNEFAAAITDRCVSNLVSMFGSSDFVEPPDLYFPGNAWDTPEPRWDQSPMKHIGNARTPTLIIHSEGDLRCNVEQSEQIHAALTVLNVPTRFVRYPSSTSHGMSRCGPPDLRQHRLEQILDWLDRYL